MADRFRASRYALWELENSEPVCLSQSTDHAMRPRGPGKTPCGRREPRPVAFARQPKQPKQPKALCTSAVLV
ncbi:hypothetical protein [Microbispora bryophytorum]|uniref:hypothetical protein n=1 Tax=Microbispora bryophytorum TaxID=1460882 RepID=UPI0033D89EF0